MAISLGIISSSNKNYVGPVYAIGDTGPGGGKVFYVAPTVFTGGASSALCKYLEAAPITGASAWTDAAYVWSGNTSTLVGTASAIGTGYVNTVAMVAQNNTASRAGTVSRAYRGPNNLSDWYLPSKDELDQLYNQRTTVGADFNADNYWSSSEEGDPIRAWQHLSNLLKSLTNYVRPIRAF